MTPVSDPGRYHTSRLAGIEIDAGASDRWQARQASWVRRTLPRSGVSTLSGPAGSSAHAEGLWNESHRARLEGIGPATPDRYSGGLSARRAWWEGPFATRVFEPLHAYMETGLISVVSQHAEEARWRPAADDSRQAWLAASAASASARV
jgi:hypothetical protein